MSARPRPAPPSGRPPPRRAELADGTEVDLEALATEICARYRAEYPDEDERYGAAGEQWCRHDNQYLVNWAVLDTRAYVSIEEQVAWLAKVLEAREFPLDHLAGNLLIAADVIAARVAGAEPVAERLRGAAALVRSTPSFL